MKNLNFPSALNFFTSLLFLFVGVLFTSCQKEEIDIIDETPGDAITLETPLTNLLLNTTQNNGGIDDFIDGSPCTSIQFPYQVIVNGQTITIENESDLINLSNTSAAITIIFPVTVVFEDFSTLVVNNQEELDALAQVCQSIGEAINCIELVYPITLFIYNSNNEQTGTVVVNSDAELFNLLSSLDEGVYVAIEYPISVILADGSQVTVTSNAQLEGLIESCEDTLPDPPTPSELEAILTTDSWFVSFFFDDEDETYEFAGFEFVFNTDGSATASNGVINEPGTWSISTSSSGNLKLILDFGDEDPLDELDEDWRVLDFSNELIRLKDDDDLLSFSRTPNTGGNSGDALLLSDTMIDGTWFVALYLDDGDEDETSNYDSFSFDFQSNGVVIASNTSVSLSGTWFVTGTDDNLKVILNFFDVYPLDELDDDWLVIEFQNNQVKLADDDDSDADILIFEKF